jgi:hypothetical protein
MKYLTYSLSWDGSLGEQPYVDLKGLDIAFTGGVIVKDATPCTGRVYFGYLDGADVEQALSICDEKFQMTELTAEEALAFWMQVIPLNSVRTELEGGVKYTGQAAIGEDGKISVPLSDTPY